MFLFPFVFFRAFHEFASSHGGQLPRPGNRSDANEFYALVCSRNEAAQNAMSDGNVFSLTHSDLEQHEKMLKRFAMTSRGLVSPVCSVVGGVVGQEVLKACSGECSIVVRVCEPDSRYF